MICANCLQGRETVLGHTRPVRKAAPLALSMVFDWVLLGYTVNDHRYSVL